MVCLLCWISTSTILLKDMRYDLQSQNGKIKAVRDIEKWGKLTPFSLEEECESVNLDMSPVTLKS